MRQNHTLCTLYINRRVDCVFYSSPLTWKSPLSFVVSQVLVNERMSMSYLMIMSLIMSVLFLADRMFRHPTVSPDVLTGVVVLICRRLEWMALFLLGSTPIFLADWPLWVLETEHSSYALRVSSTCNGILGRCWTVVCCIPSKKFLV